MTKRLFLFSLALLWATFISAQTIPLCPNDTPPADFCPDACVLCNLDEYHGSTIGYTGQTPNGFCGTIENEQWFGFIAVSNQATITAVPSNCSNGDGIQVALYQTCTGNPVPNGCDMGENGGGDISVSITVNLTPGESYFLMIDGWAGDQCEYTMTVDPPWAAQGSAVIEEIILCPGEIFTFDGVDYTAPNTIPVTLPSSNVCDSFLVYNLVLASSDTLTTDVELCGGEPYTIDGVEYFAPNTVSFNIPGECDNTTVQQYNLILKEYNQTSQTILFCQGESVTVLGVEYFLPTVVMDTVAGTTNCDTIKRYILNYNLNPSDCPSCSPTFFKTIGFDGQNVRGRGIYNAPDGNFYVTGAKQDSALLLKVSPAGAILWSYSFDLVPGANEHISEIITDSDGRIAGCGQTGDTLPNVAGFVFRFNPLTQTMIWARLFGSEAAYVNGILELSSQGNYLLYYNQNQPENNAGLIQVSRINGLFLNSFLSKKIDVGEADNYSSIVINNNELYCIGHYSTAASALNRRHSLTRIDQFGDISFASMNHVPTTGQARLSGTDLLIENNHVISVGYGNEAGTAPNNNRVFLYKHTLTGNLVWAKRIDLEDAAGEAVEEIVSVPDGFVLYCRDLPGAAGDLYLVKTDKDGALLWSKKLAYGFSDPSQRNSAVQSQILSKGGYLYFTGTTTDAAGRQQLLLLKTDGNGTLEGDCAFFQHTPTTLIDITNPFNGFPPGFIQIPPTLSTVPGPVPMVQTTLNTAKACRVFVTDDTEIALCPGQSVTIDGVDYTAPGVVADTIPGNAGCDTIVSITLILLENVLLEETIEFCPGESVTIGGNVYTQSGTVLDTILATTGCDTIVTYTLILLQNPTLEETVEFCPGESVTIGGNTYDQPGIVVDTLAAATGCDTIVTYTLILLDNPTLEETVEFCPGESVTIGGNTYDQPGIVVDTLAAATGCDTIVTYTLILLDNPTLEETVEFCPGESVTIGGNVYDQPGIVVDTLAAAAGCDTIVTYTLILLQNPVREETVEFCPGESVTIGGNTYDQPGIVVDTLAASAGCDTIVTYTLILLENPVREETIEFCSGESVTIGGNVYTQPGTVVETIPASVGCDTIVTYHLLFSTTPNSAVSIVCPASIALETDFGTGPVAINYDLPAATSDCDCPGIELTLTQGLASGSLFPVGGTTVCYAAADSCGNTAECCFSVSINESSSACDVKVIGCMKYELLTITKEAGGDLYTYRVRVTNNCANKLIYSAIQIPTGVFGIEPVNNTLYTAPSGREYLVRNPNYTPFFSVRFKSVQDSIANGQSDIFEYVIPGQAPPTFIHVTSRLLYQVFYEAHLNTFYCPVGVTPEDRSARSRGLNNLRLFPNPTTGDLFADFSDWENQPLRVNIVDSRGQRVQTLAMQANGEPQQVSLPEALANGLYFFEVWTEKGERQVVRFVVQR